MTPEFSAAAGQMQQALATVKRLAASAGTNPLTTNQQRDLGAAVTGLVAGRQAMRADRHRREQAERHDQPDRHPRQ